MKKIIMSLLLCLPLTILTFAADSSSTPANPAKPQQQSATTLSAKEMAECTTCLLARTLFKEDQAFFQKNAQEGDLKRTPAALKHAIQELQKKEKNQDGKFSPNSLAAYKKIRMRLEQELAQIITREGETVPSVIDEEYPSGYYKDATGYHKENPFYQQFWDKQDAHSILSFEIRKDAHEEHDQALKEIWQKNKCARIPAVLESAIQKLQRKEQNQDGDFSPNTIAHFKKMREQLEKELLELLKHEKEAAPAQAKTKRAATKAEQPQ